MTTLQAVLDRLMAEGADAARSPPLPDVSTASGGIPNEESTPALSLRPNLELAAEQSAAIETPALHDSAQAALQALIQEPAPAAGRHTALDSGQGSTISLVNIPAGDSQAVAGTERTPTLELRIPLGGQGWDGDLAEGVLWMVREHSQNAHIRLNPPGLGPVGVSIQVQDEQATVHFQASHAAVREALDLAVPRLREMLADSGISLAGVNITQHGAGEHGGRSAHDLASFAPGSGSLDKASPAPDEPQGRAAARSLGLIDLYV
jgi:hypothetical protein